MDSGLSKRMNLSLQELLPKISETAPPKLYDYATAIDLSIARNEVILGELLEFFKTTIEDKFTQQTFALPTTRNEDFPLRQALTSFFNSYFNPIHPVLPEHIAVTAGVSDALESLIHAICDDGDSVIVPGPYWYGYETLLKSRANVNTIVAHPPTYQNHDNYLLASLQATYNFATERSRIKAVILCNPHNPLAQCYPKKALIECMEFCQEQGLHFICDEIFALTALRGLPASTTPFVSALSLTEPLVPEGAVKIDPSRVHVVWSTSKLFGTGGLRIGCVVSQQNPQLCSAISLLTTNHMNNVSSLFLSSLLTWSQLPTLLALNSERLTESYQLLANSLRQWDVTFVPPTHGIFLFAKLAKNAKTAEEEKEFFDKLAIQGVRVGAGRFYKGVELEYGWARIRFSVSKEVMTSALAKIGAFLESNA